MPTGPALTDDELRVDTPQYTWCFDRLRQRFRRLPRGRDPRDPAVHAEWEPYSRLWRGADGALTVLLDSAGTLRLRVVGLTRRWRGRDASQLPEGPEPDGDVIDLVSTDTSARSCGPSGHELRCSRPGDHGAA